MSECTHDCNSCGEDCSKRDFQVAPHKDSKIKKVIGIISGKGGVGKSLVTTLLASRVNKDGFRTAILDADITGPSIPESFGVGDERAEAVEGQEALKPVVTESGIQLMSMNFLLQNENDPVIWRGPVIAGAVKQFWTDVIWKDIDCLVVDMPPGTGDVPLTVFQSIPVDGIIVVASPQELVEMIVEKAVKMADLMKIPVLGLVENMSYFECPNCKEKHYIFGESKVEEIAKKHDIQNISRIPINSKLAGAADKGMIELYEGDWLDDLTAALKEI